MRPITFDQNPVRKSLTLGSAPDNLPVTIGCARVRQREKERERERRREKMPVLLVRRVLLLQS